MSLKCANCQKTKEEVEFYRNRNIKFKPRNFRDSYCKECKKDKIRIYIEANKEERNFNRRERLKNDPIYRKKVQEYKMKDYWNNIPGRLLYSARSRAKRKNIKFNITIEDIIIPNRCPILKVKFDKDRYSPSIDRIYPKKGYTKGNIIIISKKANTMKNDASFEELKSFSKNILSVFK